MASGFYLQANQHSSQPGYARRRKLNAKLRTFSLAKCHLGRSSHQHARFMDHVTSYSGPLQLNASQRCLKRQLDSATYVGEDADRCIWLTTSILLVVLDYFRAAHKYDCRLLEEHASPQRLHYSAVRNSCTTSKNASGSSRKAIWLLSARRTHFTLALVCVKNGAITSSW